MSNLGKADLPQFSGLMHRTRNRMWLEATSKLLFRSFWWSGGLIFATGVLHGLGVSLSWRFSLLLGLAPLIIAAAVGIFFHRPSLTCAAAWIDGWLGSNELMVSALAQARLPSNKRAGAADFVLHQAEQTAAAVGDRQALPQWRPTTVSILFPVGLVMAGLILHQNVGLSQFPLIGNLGIGTADKKAISADSTVPADPMLDLKRSLMQIASSQNSMEARRLGPKRLLKAVPLSTPATREGKIEDGGQAALKSTIRPGQSRTFARGPPFAGLEGAGTVTLGAIVARETPFKNLTPIFRNIERRGRSGAAKEGRVLSSVVPGSETEKPENDQSPSPVERIELSHEASFGPTMRAYIHAYFSQLQQGQ